MNKIKKWSLDKIAFAHWCLVQKFDPPALITINSNNFDSFIGTEIIFRTKDLPIQPAYLLMDLKKGITVKSKNPTGDERIDTLYCFSIQRPETFNIENTPEFTRMMEVANILVNSMYLKMPWENDPWYKGTNLKPSDLCNFKIK